MESSVVRPKITIKKEATIATSYDEIIKTIENKIGELPFSIGIECYPVTNENLIKEKMIEPLKADNVVKASDLFYSSKKVTDMIKTNLTDDRIFGLMSHHQLTDFIDQKSYDRINDQFNSTEKKLNIIYGMGASLIENLDLIIYVDLARWEIQTRYRSGEYSNWKANNAGEDPLRMIKRGYFFEWRVADRYKRELSHKIDYLLDIHDEAAPKMIDYPSYLVALEEVASQPFSLVPFFDPGVWGGNWMQKTFGVDQEKENLAWSFNGVPEENSLLLDFGGTQIEIPANNLIFEHAEKLLGRRAFGRFGHEFPIRFNFLDTMGGQNLSLQVHPKVDYTQMNFGAHYTQDESYYILEAEEDAVVYLGVKNGVKEENLIQALEEAETTGQFDDEKYIHRHIMKKHDHFLIPSGTIHSSGKDSVVLEISATPNRFTFKLWDWDRVDFDGLPRPVNVNHGKHNIDIYKDADWVEKELVNVIEPIEQGEGWSEERTGLHETEFIETRRHKFSKKVHHINHGSVNVLNLVEGEEALVTSVDNRFEPFKVTYAQTFIIPASIREYYIEPIGKSIGKEIMTLKAFVR
ncbi:class I mannose-6-phosphate isomerase [Vagococcus sp.]|uniref:class I mannose-6-phosphate isomerase n=1 Tax=Vagococcus sp. TaxID=1933889 RepID=UPI003F9712EA